MRAAEAAPAAVADDELDSLFSAFPSRGRVVLAVSGGADSSALLVLAHRWRARLSAGPDLLAATVDHGLRPQSAQEAEQVAALAARCGVFHATLAWTGAKPARGLEAAARAARYDLLCAFARAQGAASIATAHTLDDQAETVLMRLAAGSGPAGLAGMGPRVRRDEIDLLRPLLGVRKARLVATLEQAGIAWAEDLHNRDHAFARARLRAAAEVLGREGLTPERLARLARRLARWEAALAHGGQAAARQFRLSTGLDGRALARAPEEIALRVLAAEIAAKGGDIPPHGLRLERLEALWDALGQALAAGRPLRRTLAGALVSADAAGVVSVSPAAPRRRRAVEKAGNAQVPDEAFTRTDVV